MVSRLYLSATKEPTPRIRPPTVGVYDIPPARPAAAGQSALFKESEEVGNLKIVFIGHQCYKLFVFNGLAMLGASSPKVTPRKVFILPSLYDSVTYGPSLRGQI